MRVIVETELPPQHFAVLDFLLHVSVVGICSETGGGLTRNYTRNGALEMENALLFSITKTFPRKFLCVDSQ
jgi:hypothetical protein